MRLYNMIGQKLFKENEDGSVHLLRIVGMRKPFKITPETKDPSEIKVYDYDSKETTKVNVSELSGYHPLEPDGILAASVVWVKNEKGEITKDVIVSVSKFLMLKLRDGQLPFAVCRQSITDIWYNLLAHDENDTMVGVAVNHNNCPANFDYKVMFACNDVEYSDFINFYRNDKLEDLYSMMNLNKFDTVLGDLYSRHVKASKNPSLAFKKEDRGWCKDLKTLLKQNNFQYDINEMLDIMQVDFNISDYLEDKVLVKDKPSCKIANDELRYWLSLQFKQNISEAAFLEYNHDINLGEFHNTNYIFLRDNTDVLYFIVYTTTGQFFEADLIEKSKEMDFSTKFKIDFYNKYNNCNNK